MAAAPPMLEVKLSSPYYLSLSRQLDFRACVMDIIERTGVSEEDNKKILFSSPNVLREELFQEFAKCFVPQSIDPIHNYELYEIFGDLSLNKATISYLFRILKPRLSKIESGKSLAYFDKLKAYYISKKFYSNLSRTIGFDEFINRVCFSDSGKQLMASKQKNIDDLHEDVMEAFIGCLELQLDTYIGMHRGFVYVSNFIYDLFSDVEINFDPTPLWTPAMLLKETNDKIRAHNTRSPQQKLSTFAVQPVLGRPNTYKMVETGRDGKGYDVQNEVVTNQDRAEAENILAANALSFIIRSGNYREDLIQRAPTPADLGITDLVASK